MTQEEDEDLCDWSDDIHIEFGEYETEIEAALAHDRAQILLWGEEDARGLINYPPEESAHVVLPDHVIRQINAIKAGWGRLQ